MLIGDRCGLRHRGGARLGDGVLTVETKYYGWCSNGTRKNIAKFCQTREVVITNLCKWMLLPILNS